MITTNRQTLPSAYGKDCRIGRAGPRHYSGADSEVSWNESIGRVAMCVAQCWPWRTTCNATGVRIASITTAPSLSLSLATPARSSASTFLAILVSTAEGDGSANDLMDSGAQTHADSGTADRMLRQQDDTQLPSVSGEVSTRGTAAAALVDRRNISPESASTEKNFVRTSDGSPSPAHEERFQAASNETPAVITPATPVVSSPPRPTLPVSASGASSQEIPERVSQEKTSESSLIGAGTKANAAFRMTSLQEDAPIPAVSDKVSARGTATAALIDHRNGNASPEQSSSTPGNIHQTDDGTSQAVNAGGSKQNVSQRELADSGAKTIAGVNATIRPASQDEDIPAASIPARVSVRGVSTAALGNQQRAAAEQNFNAPANGPRATSEAFGVANGARTQATTRPAKAPISSLAEIAAPAAQPVAVSPVNQQASLSAITTSASTSSHLPIASSPAIVSGERGRTTADETGVFIASGSTVASSYPWVPAQTPQSGNSFQSVFGQPAFGHASEKEFSGDSVADPVLETYSEAETKGPSASQQANAPIPAVFSGEITAAVKSVNQERASVEQSVKAPENSPRANDESSDSSAAGVNVRAVPVSAAVTADASLQVPPGRSTAGNSAPENTAVPSRPLTPAAPLIAPADGKPAAQTASSARTDNLASVTVPVAAEVFMLQQGLPVAAAPADNGSGSQPLANAGKKEISSATGSGNSVLASTADSATSKTTNAASGAGDALPHSAQSSAQSSPSPQADPAHAADVTPKAADSSLSQAQTGQAQTVAVQAGMAGTATQHPTATLADVAPRPTGQQDVPASIHSDGGEAVTASSINSAKLMQTMSETEMHVGMRSTEFGDISIRTSISQQQLVAQISVDHSDLSQAISAHVATMQTKLGEDFGLHTSIEVHNLGSSLSGESGQSSQREQRAFTPSARIESLLSPAEEQVGTSVGTLAAAGNSTRLDIRA
jgi:hypothetical protein